ncbi:MAG: molybdopterin cofactor-binding domain-containing protein [Pseudomonadota bacterium]
MKNIDTFLHVRGESQFVDDVVVPEGLLYAAVFSSPIACGKITRLSLAAAKEIDGIYDILTADDIPADNQIGNIIRDEPLLAESEVNFIGQPIALVVGHSAEVARMAMQAIEIEFEELPSIFDAREAYAQGQLIIPPRIVSLGEIEETWQKCDVIVEGQVESGGQEHLYLEMQGAFAYSTEMGGVKVITATQAPRDVQNRIAKVLGLALHHVEVDVLRLGGAFGGKEVQATTWAALVALAAFKLKKPVRLILRRDEDICMTGKRHPYSSDFKMGLAHDGKILAYEVTYYQNAGAFTDISPAVLDRTLLHSTNSYFVPNVKATGFCCRTNLPPNTAFRGFGTPQAMFVIESAIFKAAEKMGVEPSVIQKKNLLQENDEFPYSLKVKNSQARRCWEQAEQVYQLEQIRQDIQDFNSSHSFQKKGLALMPLCYGIAFSSAIFLCQASALLHIYSDDGSISVSTGAVEMGQGLNMKIRLVVSDIFSINVNRIKVESTNTTRVANASPTSASYSADLYGNATKLACLKLLTRIKEFAAKQLNTPHTKDIEIKNETLYLRGKPTELTWDKLISEAYLNRINLSAEGYYTTPNIHFDQSQYKGKPFAYHVFGTAIIEVTVDCLRGTYQINAVKLVHDFGKSLNPLIDRGQAEGAIVQGLGWMTLEELSYANNGRLTSGTLSTYKVPDIYFAPQEIQVHFLENSENPQGIFNSKAIGEPPFIYGIGVYFAIWQAMKAFRPDLQMRFSAPMTPEKVLLSLYDNHIQLMKEKKNGSL